MKRPIKQLFSMEMIAVSLALLPAPQVLAEVEASTVIRQYDDSRTRVTSPSIDVSAKFDRDTSKITFGWAQDILTSASADVETFASKGEIDDKRTEYSVGVEHAIPDGALNVGYIQSDEDDYHSKAFSAGGTREFFQKNTVVSFGFASGDDRINSMADSTFEEKMRNQLYSLSLTQVLSKISILQLIYDFRVENGYIASPYRRAKIINSSTGTIRGEHENHPRTRNRNAWALKYNRYFDKLALTSATTYRLYQDSWGVLSHTIEERLTKELGRKWNLSFTLRYYTQQQAKFFSDYYIDDPGPFYTGNNTLASFDGYMLSLRPAVQITDNIGLFTKVEYFSQSFKNASDAHKLETRDDDTLLEIQALVIGLGLTAKF